jgi:hypothetical protein
MKFNIIFGVSILSVGIAFGQNDTLWHDIWGGTGQKDADLTKKWAGLSSIWTVRYANSDSAQIYGNGTFSGHTFLIYKTLLLDFEVETTQRLPGTTTNSGLQLRSTCATPGDSIPCGTSFTVYGPQADVGATHNGELYNEGTGPLVNVNTTPATGSNYTSSVTACRQTQKAYPQWNVTRARVLGNKITGYLNDSKCYEFTIGATQGDWLKAGIFALQYHGTGGTVEYKSIKMKQLNIPVGISERTPLTPEKTILTSTGQRNIAYTTNTIGPFTVVVQNLQGKVVSIKRGSGPKVNLNLEVPAFGLYLVRVSTQHTNTTTKIYAY